MPRIKKTLSKGRLSAIISAPAKALRMAPMRPTPCIQLEPVARAEGPLGAFLFDADEVDALVAERTTAVTR